jgi:methylthioribulose-1-phosphate dehydratase
MTTDSAAQAASRSASGIVALAMPSFAEAISELADAGRAFDARGWVLAGSGNMSAVLARQPLRLAITASGKRKGALQPEHFLQLDEGGEVQVGQGRASDEAPLHLAIVRERNAGAVLHSHSVWGTLASDACAEAGGVRLSGWEMLKGLSGVTTHLHSEWVPILENSQDYPRLAGELVAALQAHTACHAVLLRGHGLYAWGRDVAEAKRHVEVLEFLFEVVGRRAAAPGGEAWRS